LLGTFFEEVTMSAHTATVSSRCDEVIAKYSLLRHAFYRRWTDGMLPVPALKDYAREYGTFIRSIGRGWEAVGEPGIARVEDGHAEVWESTFADGLGTSVTAPKVKEVADLVAVSRELFAQRATAVGGLYAFEAQQPLIAQAKLKGLREHYAQLPERCGEYFRLHSEGYDEPSLLADEMNAMSLGDQERAFAACERMCQALSSALTGIHAPYAGHGDGSMQLSSTGGA
jgi:pyrroloquinoline-quinone synthase